MSSLIQQCSCILKRIIEGSSRHGMRISRMNLWCCGPALDPPRVDCIAQLVESIATDKLLPRSQNVIISSPHFHFAVESRAPFSIGTFPACSFACISRLYDVTTFLCPFRFGCLNGPDARRTLLCNRRFLRPRTFK